MLQGAQYFPSFVASPDLLFDSLSNDITWDERMVARKTASFGKAYNYSQIEYPYQPFLPTLEVLSQKIFGTLGFTPNNCLINLYPDGKSKMGFHSDQIDILNPGTGVAIVSLGETRFLNFRNIAEPALIDSYQLAAGSLFYMTQEVQLEWLHAIPKSDTAKPRMSLTFRSIRDF